MSGILVSHDRVFQLLRQIAKKDYWQILYSQAKELSCLTVFDNEKNLTYFQIYFLNQLSFYSSLYMDIAMGDVSKVVTDNEIYEDAYVYYKRNKTEKNKITTPSPKIKSDKEEVVQNKNQWVFTKVKGK